MKKIINSPKRLQRGYAEEQLREGAFPELSQPLLLTTALEDEDESAERQAREEQL